MFRTIALTGFAALIAATTLSLAPPARAQIGNIFSDPPPRPPGAIPRGDQPQPPPDDEEEVPELPRGRLLPTPNRPLPGQGVPPPGSVQSQPLAPPPGTTVIPQNTQPGIAIGRRRRAARPVRASPTRRHRPIRCRDCRPGSASPRASRVRRRPCSRAMRWCPSRPRQKSPTRRRASPASTRSPDASSISTRISARPSSSARCG